MWSAVPLNQLMMQMLKEAPLQQKAQDLAPDESRIAEFKAAVHFVTTAVHKQSGVDGTVVTRVVKAGSLAKSTSLHGSDADVVLFVRNIYRDRLPPQATADILVRMESLLETTAKAQDLHELTIIRRSGHVMTMRYGETEIDMLVARDFCTAVASPTPGIQAYEALRFIERLPADEKARYSVSFTELSVQFIKQQPEHTNKFIRLVKQYIMNNTTPLQLNGLDGGADWNMKAHAKSLGISNNAIELLATKAVWTVDSRERKPARRMLPYFEQFHELLSGDTADLAIHFPLDTWPAAIRKLVTDVRGAQALFDSFCTPAAVAARPKPLVQDPTNPTNNVVARITPVGWSMLRKASDPQFALQEVSTVTTLQ
jgi:2'-5'-oligoadenylate synthetase 1, domain 2, C-terminus